MYHFNPVKNLNLTEKCKNSTGGTNGYLHAEEQSPTSHRIQNYLKIDHRPKCRAKTVKLLEGNIGVWLCDLGIG